MAAIVAVGGIIKNSDDEDSRTMDDSSDNKEEVEKPVGMEADNNDANVVLSR